MMPDYVLVVDFFAAIAVFIGFSMAFRQAAVRRIIRRRPPRVSSLARTGGEGDPITYILRIAGVMTMVFGIAIGGMVTLFNLA